MVTAEHNARDDQDRPQEFESGLATLASRDGDRSSLSDSIGRDFEALEATIAREIADRSKLRKLIQRLKAAWQSGDRSAERLMKDPGIAQLRALYPGTDQLFTRLTTDLGRQRAGRSSVLTSAVQNLAGSIAQPLHGRYPRFTLGHFVEVSIDDQRGRVKVGGMSVQSLEWSKIRPAIEKEIARQPRNAHPAGNPALVQPAQRQASPLRSSGFNGTSHFWSHGSRLMSRLIA